MKFNRTSHTPRKLYMRGGFTLLEVLIAAVVIGLGLILVAMVFPVGIKLTTIATERTVGTLAVNEAVAKVQLWGFPPLVEWAPEINTPLNTPHTECILYPILLRKRFPLLTDAQFNVLTDSEFVYPSAADGGTGKYFTSVLCRALDGSQVQITALAMRALAADSRFWKPNGDTDGQRPVPVKVKVGGINDRPLELEIKPEGWAAPAPYVFFVDGGTVIDDKSGQIYQVFEVKTSGGTARYVVLDRAWKGGTNGTVWVVPPAVGSRRNPLVGVVQTVVSLQ